MSRRAFGSAGVRLCEKKEGTTSPPSEDVKSDGTGQLQSKRSEEIDMSPEQKTEVRSEAVSQDTHLKPHSQTKPAATAEEKEVRPPDITRQPETNMLASILCASNEPTS